jgi:hypothetical protein
MEEMDETEAVPQVHFRHFVLSLVAFLAVCLVAEKTKEERVKHNSESFPEPLQM